MTLGNAISRVRKITRTSALSHSDTEVMNTINEGLRQFSKDTYGNLTEAYLKLQPKFDTGTNWGLKMTAGGATASFAITSTDRIDATGGTVASDLQTAIQAANATAIWATATVSWSTITWKFAVTFASSSTITFASPTKIGYADATEVFGDGSQTSTVWTSGVPEDSVIETDLPTDFMSIRHVEWDKRPLQKMEFSPTVSPEYSSRPTHYHIRNRKIRLYPNPSRQELFHVWYEAKYTEFVDAATQTASDIPLDPPYDDAVVFYASSAIAEENEEGNKAQYNRQKYLDQVQKYRVEVANQNPKKKEPVGFIYPQWIVVSES